MTHMSELQAPTRQLETVSVVEALEDDLERRVLEREFQPGEHLREVELSEEYQVGRHTLRAAFDGLARRGILEKARNRGVFVRLLTDHDLVEIYQLRLALEAEAFRALALRREAPKGAVEALRQLRRLNARSPQQAFVEADLAFHGAIVDATRNLRLARAHRELGAEMRLLLAQLVNRYATARELAAEHTQLLKAIGSGDPDVAEAAIRDHLERATEWLIEHATTRPASAE
jgi:DNA-binding GntR family transcriptional regulator